MMSAPGQGRPFCAVCGTTKDVVDHICTRCRGRMEENTRTMRRES